MSDRVVQDGATAADGIAAVVLAVDGVNRLDAGPVGAVATLLPGRRINGLRLTDHGAEVHIAVDWGQDVRQVAEAVRVRVQPLVGGPVDVVVEDVIDLTDR